MKKSSNLQHACILVAVFTAGVLGVFAEGKAEIRVVAPTSYAPAVKKVSGATVTIVNAIELTPEEAAKFSKISEERKEQLAQSAAVFQLGGKLYGRRGHGSGFIVDSAGHVVTNDHVVAAGPDEEHPGRTVADAFFVAIGHDRSWIPAKLVGTDRATDIAVLKIEVKNPPVAEWGDSSVLEPGDVVLAIGTPKEIELNQTVTMGIVSAVGRSHNGMLQYEDFIQTDAPINGGNSGGPLINTLGQIIGVNQSIALGSVSDAAGQRARNSGDGDALRSEGNIGIGFAVPSNLAKKVSGDLIKSGRVRRGYLGIKLDERRAPSKEGNIEQLLQASSVKVAAVLPESPAEKAGVRSGDIIAAFEKSVMADTRAFHLAVSLAEPGSKVELRLLRDGKPLAVTVTLGDLAATPYAAIGFDPRGVPCPQIEGVEIVELDSDQLSFLAKGETLLMIKTVVPGSPAAVAGLRQLTAIVEVAGVPVRTVDQLIAVASTSVRDGHLLLRVKARNLDKEISVPVKIPKK